jgi:ATP-dependent DNA helicase RecQ
LQYFGQNLGKDNCAACDICLGEMEYKDDALITAQKILSCVVRLGQKFGGSYTALVLTGSKEKRIFENGHNTLSTYALLKDYNKSVVQNWIEQLAGQGCLEKTGEYNILTVTEKGRLVLKGKQTPRLLEPVKRESFDAPGRSAVPWEGVEAGLFEELRLFRRAEAAEKGIPPFVVFGDATLRQLAKVRPSSARGLMAVKGVGAQKRQQYGRAVLTIIRRYCEKHSLDMDVYTEPEAASFTHKPRSRSARSNAKASAFKLFSLGCSIREVAAMVNRAESTTVQYLIEFILQENITNPSAWVDRQTAQKIEQAIRKVGSKQLKLIFDHLIGQVDYNQIRITLACLRNH